MISDTFVYSQNLNLEYDRIDTDEGLSDSEIRAIIQDKRGYIWIGTASGLNRYDAYNLYTFPVNRKDTTALINDEITALFEDNSGKIWVGTTNGLSIYNPMNQKFTSFKANKNGNTLQDNNILSILQDKKNQVWVGTEDGISIFDPETLSIIKQFNESEKDLVGNRITSMCEDVSGNIWIGTSNGISVFNLNSKTFTNYKSNIEDPSTIPYDYISDIVLDHRGNIFVGTRNGIARFDRTKKTFIRYTHNSDNTNSLISNFVNALAVDPFGTVWIATDIGISTLDLGLKKFSNYNFTSEKTGELMLDKATCILSDQNNIIWVGTEKHGLLKIDTFNQIFESYNLSTNLDHPLIHPHIWSVSKDRSHRIWIATPKGLSVLDSQRKKFTTVKSIAAKEFQLSSEQVSVTYVDRKGFVWIGTFNEGLNRLINIDTDTTDFKFESYTSVLDDSTTLSMNPIRAIFEDKHGELWVGTIYGLNRGERNSDGSIKRFYRYFRNRSDSTSLSDETINTIFESKSGDLWIGTNKGLNKVLRDEFGKVIGFKAYLTDEDNPNSLSANKIKSIAEDSKGFLYIATTVGIDVFNPYEEEFSPLPNRYNNQAYIVQGMLIDSKDILWISTEKGLLKYIRKLNRFTRYTQKDGLHGNEFVLNSFSRSFDEEFFFGGTQGFSSFYPDKIQPNKFQPNIELTDFKIFNKSVPIRSIIFPNSPLEAQISFQDEIELDYTDYIFTIEFVALNFRQPEHNTYAYQMVGLDTGWNIIGDIRTVTFNNLRPGNYTFLVKAANNDGLWNPNPKILKIYIRPPIYLSTWFIVLCSFLVLGGIFLLIRWRFLQIQRQKVTLERLIKLRTGEIIEKNFELEKQQSELKQSYENVRVLNDIGKKLTSTLSFDEIIHILYVNMHQLIDTPLLSIALFDPIAEELEFLAFKQDGTALPKRRVSMYSKSNLLVQAFVNNKTIVINDPVDKNFYVGKHGVLEGDLPNSALYMPLRIKTEVKGLLAIESSKSGAFTPYQVSLADNLATFVTTAFENAQAYEQINDQKKEIEMRNKAVTDSINYAKRIQESMLPPIQTLRTFLPESFVFFRPRDIVSGDFYWFLELDDQIFIAAVDCTGHGVPGAFMSMLGDAYLNQAVHYRKIFEPHRILHELHENIRTALKQDISQNQDGMDIALCRIDRSKNLLTFAGAHNPLITVRDSEVKIYPSDPYSIGGTQMNRFDDVEPDMHFHSHEIELDGNTQFYIFSDGFQDQFGGEHGRKYMKKNFRTLLREISKESADQQYYHLERELNEWIGTSQHQIDDILIIGFKA